MRQSVKTYWWHVPANPVHSNRFAIYGIGIRERVSPAIVSRPNGMKVGYLLMYFHDQAEIGCGEKICSFGPSRFMIWTPEQAQHYGHPSQVWNHSWMICSGPYVREILEENQIPVNTPLGPVAAELLEESLELAYREVAKHEPPDEIILRNAFSIWMRQMARLLWPSKSGGEVPVAYSGIREYLDENFHLPLSIHGLAKRVHVSVPHFCREFHRYYHVSPMQYVIRKRMQRAAYLAQYRDLRIGEIAREVGCPDPHHFSKQFRKHYGVSPSEMRNRD